MRKYKLIKEYPESPKLHTVIEFYDDWTPKNENTLHQSNVEPYPSFWEEICIECGESKPTCAIIKKCGKFKEEPNYLITAFRDKSIINNIFYLQSNGKYNEVGRDGILPLKGMLNGFASVEDGAFEIYKVKNSKGEEFVLGELVKFSTIKLKIAKFEISQFNEMHLFLENGNRYSLDLIFKVKEPLYTTTDDVEMFEGDKLHLFLATKDLTIPYANEVEINMFNKADKEVADRYLTFTSAESRDKYIKEHTRKPIFVSADGKEIFEGDKYYPVNIGKNEYYTWKTYDCEPDGLNKNTTIYKHIMYFSTEEARQEYIDNNKPKYSLADIENCYPHANITGNRIKDIPVVVALFSNLKKLGK